MNEINLENHGKIWELEEDSKLRSLFGDGLVIPDICLELGRTPYAVTQRLVDLKLIFFDNSRNVYKTAPVDYLHVRTLQIMQRDYK